MGLIKESYRQVLCESNLNQLGIDKSDGLIFEAAKEIYLAAAYYDEPLNENVQLTDQDLKKLFKIVPKMKQYGKPTTSFGDNAKAAGQASAKHLQQIASTIGKWQNKLMGKAADTQTGQKLNAKLDQIRDTIDKNAGKIPGGQTIVDTAKKIGELAKKNPKTAAFATAALAGLGGALTANPLAGAAIGKGLQAALGVMKGEKATDILVKGGTAIAAGMVGGALADSFGVESLDELPQQEINSSGGVDSYSINGEEVSKEEFENNSFINRMSRIIDLEHDQLVNQVADVAQKMGLSGDSWNAKVVGGVPVEINGQPVPTEMLSDDQLAAIKKAESLRNWKPDSNNSGGDDIGYSPSRGTGNFDREAYQGLDKSQQQIFKRIAAKYGAGSDRAEEFLNKFSSKRTGGG